MKLIVNDWMAWDLVGVLYAVVYAESETEWWIMARRDEYFDALVALAECAEEGGPGEYFIINGLGEIVRG